MIAYVGRMSVSRGSALVRRLAGEVAGSCSGGLFGANDVLGENINARLIPADLSIPEILDFLMCSRAPRMRQR
jgi:hypothetical protein